eukprot:g3947.t1
MDDRRKLLDYDIQKEATIYVAMRLHGGMDRGLRGPNAVPPPISPTLQQIREGLLFYTQYYGPLLLELGATRFAEHIHDEWYDYPVAQFIVGTFVRLAAIGGGIFTIYSGLTLLITGEIVDGVYVVFGATTATFERYDDILFKTALRKNPLFTWCKAINCGSGQLHIDGKKCPIVTCNACQAKSCFSCQGPWHSGQTCKQYFLDSNANTRWLNRHTKKCPKCKSPIEKNNGCDHMTCKRQAGGCGHEFCWRCLAPWGPIIRRGGGNHHHRPTCFHYRALSRSGGMYHYGSKE